MGFTAWVNRALILANVLVYLLITLPLSRQGVDPNDPAVAEYLRFLVPQLPAVARPPHVPVREILASIDAYSIYVYTHGFKPGAPEVSDLFEGLFLHGGFAHLAGNMLFLWIYGDNVEHRLGRVGYFVAYLVTGVAATGAFTLVARGSMAPLVGASGAISGVLGFYFVMFPRNKVKMLFLLSAQVLYVPARVVLALYVIVENLLPQLLSARSNVAYGAHLGGFVAGFGLALAVQKASAWRTREQVVAERPAGPGQPLTALAGLRAALERGDDVGAVEALRVVDEGEILRLRGDEILRIAGLLQRAGAPEAAIRVLKSYLAAHPTGPDASLVYFALALERLERGQVTAGYQHLLAALDAGPSSETEARIREVLARVPRS
ncbi:MAG: rhomboid family intramembrane serine protease [Deltaproteobacteria bacterium]|nr:rhomboid family intramembrane serine protease [Deltaproteobacteria bacterium]